MTTYEILTARGPAPLSARISVACTLWRLTHGGRVFNLSTRRVGGLRFVKIGRFTLMLCVSKEYKPL